MDLRNGVCSACQLAVLLVKNYFGHYTQTVSPIFCIPAMFFGTIDFYHFIPLLHTAILPADHKVSAKQNFLTSFSYTLFI